MKKSSDNYSDNISNGDNPIESAKPLDSFSEINSPEEYKDPDRNRKTWCSYMEKGFRASRTLTAEETVTNTEHSGGK